MAISGSGSAGTGGGDATLAEQQTQTTKLDAIKTAVEVIDNFISGTKGLVTEDNSASIKTAVETIDNFISGSRGLVTEDNSAAIKTAVEIIDNFISGSKGLVTEDNSAAIKTAVEIIDNMISGNEAQVDVITQPARAATTDTITAKIATDAIQNGTTALTPKWATIAVSSSGVNTIVSAVTSPSNKIIRVLQVSLVANAAVNAKWQSDSVSPVDKTGLAYFAANGGYTLPFSPVGWFETATGKALVLNLSGSVAVGGVICYVEV